MFENTKRQFPSFFSDKTAYVGTDSMFNEQIMEPLKTLGSKNTFKNSDAEKIAVAITCMKVLGDTVSKVPIKVFQATDNGNQVDKEDYRYDLLQYSPDGIITAQAFFGALEYNRNLKGNAFAKINRDRISGKVLNLEFIPSNLISGFKKVRGQLYYIYHNPDKKKETVINSEDMLHFKMITKNSIWGINPIEAQRMNLSTTYKAKNTVDSFYENNAFVPKYLKSLIPEAQFQKPFAEAMKNWKKGGGMAGPANAGTIGTLPPFTEIQELSLDPMDEKFIQGMKFDAAQIASFYGVPPDKVGVFEYSKYNNVEQANLAFKNDTLSAIFKMYRAELEMKLLTTQERKAGKSIEFVTQALVETDIATRVAYYEKMQSLGVMTPNSIAALEGLPTFADGDKHYMSSQTVPIEDRDKDVEDETEDVSDS